MTISHPQHLAHGARSGYTPDCQAAGCEGPQAGDRLLSEKAFAAQVVQLAKICGWMVYHTWLPIHSPAGFPDLVLVRGSEMLCVELKSEKGKLSPEQEEWLEALGHVETVEAFCWRPHHWPMIEEALAR